MLHPLANGSWVTLADVRRISLDAGHPGECYFGATIYARPPGIAVWLGDKAEWVEFDDADAARSYADELASLVNGDADRAIAMPNGPQ